MMKNLVLIIFLIFICLSIMLSSNIINGIERQVISRDKLSNSLTSDNYYFYVYGLHTCLHCRAMIKFLNETYGSEHLYFCDLNTNTTCYQKFIKLTNAGLPGYVPTVFIVYNCTVTAVLIGEYEDKSFINQFMKTNMNKTIPIYVVGQGYMGDLIIKDHISFINTYLKYDGYCFMNNQAKGSTSVEVVKHYEISQLIVPLIILSLIDSVNPCTLTLYFSFIITLLATGRKVFGPSIVFILIIYAGYLAMGLGFKTIAQILPYKILLIIALILGIYYIIDAGRRYKREMECRLCNRLDITKRVIKNPYITAALLSLLSVTVLLPCTSGPLMIFASIIRDYPLYISIPALMIYNLFFITPLIIIWIITTLLNKKRAVADFLIDKSAIIEFFSGIALILIALYYL